MYTQYRRREEFFERCINYNIYKTAKNHRVTSEDKIDSSWSCAPWV